MDLKLLSWFLELPTLMLSKSLYPAMRNKRHNTCTQSLCRQFWLAALSVSLSCVCFEFVNLLPIIMTPKVTANSSDVCALYFSCLSRFTCPSIFSYFRSFLLPISLSFLFFFYCCFISLLNVYIFLMCFLIIMWDTLLGLVLG